MASLNKLFLIGNVGQDPEIRILESGAKVANLNVAVTKKYRDRIGEQHEETEWFQVKAWRALADVAEQYITKGMQIYVEGSVHTRKWEQNGETRYATEIIADQIQMLGSRPRQEGGSAG